MRTPITPRDAYLYHEIAKAERCKPISETIRLCAIDVATIRKRMLCSASFSILSWALLRLYVVGVACFIWLIIWGIPLLIRGYKWYKLRRRNNVGKQPPSEVDQEKGSVTPSSTIYVYCHTFCLKIFFYQIQARIHPLWIHSSLQVGSYMTTCNTRKDPRLPHQYTRLAVKPSKYASRASIWTGMHCHPP